MIYLDNNSTTRPSPAVVAAMHECLAETWHNPSSMHRPGQAARQRIELARRSLAGLLGAKPREITFTSGGTEALNLGIRGVLDATRTLGKRTVVTTAIEHRAIRDLTAALETRGDCTVRMTPLLDGGIVDVDALADLIDDATALVCIQWASNETGVIQPVEQIGELCRERGVTFLCDGTQWIGKLPTDLEKMPIDLCVMAAHKFHGPKGAGALYHAKGVRYMPVTPGSQELGRRGGTENTPGIVGMGVAAEEAAAWLEDPASRERIASLRDHFEVTLAERIGDVVVNKPPAPHERLWNTANIGFPRLEAEALLFLMSEKGLCASAGSACSSGSLEPSPVLLAMGVPPEVAHGSIRFSLSRETTAREIEEALDIICGCAEKLRGSMSATA